MGASGNKIESASQTIHTPQSVNPLPPPRKHAHTKTNPTPVSNNIFSLFSLGFQVSRETRCLWSHIQKHLLSLRLVVFRTQFQGIEIPKIVAAIESCLMKRKEHSPTETLIFVSVTWFLRSLRSKCAAIHIVPRGPFLANMSCE